jgi:hypothetical protein
MVSRDDERERLRLLAKDYMAAAWACWMTPLFAVVPLFFPLLEPSSIPSALLDGWELYLLFVALPWALGVASWLHSRKLKKRA